MSNPRTNYEMTEADLSELMEAMKPVPMMMIGGTTPRSQQENANAAWAKLGAKMGFDPMSVRPCEGEGYRHFTAIPNETPEQQAERESIAAEERRQSEIARLTKEIAERQEALAKFQPAGGENDGR